MYEKAKYFSSKFIRNGIAGLALSCFIIYSIVHDHKQFDVLFVLIPIVAFAWLYSGIRINKKLKLKDQTKEQAEIIDERISYKQIELLISLLIVLVIFLGMNHWKYVDYLTIPVLMIFAWWLYSQMKILNKYLNS
jgi:hypothetical protein